MDNSMSLTPDDNERLDLELPQRNAEVEQPYGLTSILVALALLLVVRIVATRAPIQALWIGAIVVAIAVYSVLTAVRPRLPLMAVAILAAELGLLLNLPANELFAAPWHNPLAPFILLTQLICAGVVGAFTSWALSVEKYPNLVIGINFLAMFVVMGISIIFNR